MKMCKNFRDILKILLCIAFCNVLDCHSFYGMIDDNIDIKERDPIPQSEKEIPSKQGMNKKIDSSSEPSSEKDFFKLFSNYSFSFENYSWEKNTLVLRMYCEVGDYVLLIKKKDNLNVKKKEDLHGNDCFIQYAIEGVKPTESIVEIIDKVKNEDWNNIGSSESQEKGGEISKDDKDKDKERGKGKIDLERGGEVQQKKMVSRNLNKEDFEKMISIKLLNHRFYDKGCVKKRFKESFEGAFKSLYDFLNVDFEKNKEQSKKMPDDSIEPKIEGKSSFRPIEEFSESISSRKGQMFSQNKGKFSLFGEENEEEIPKDSAKQVPSQQTVPATFPKGIKRKTKNLLNQLVENDEEDESGNFNKRGEISSAPLKSGKMDGKGEKTWPSDEEDIKKAIEDPMFYSLVKLTELTVFPSDNTKLLDNIRKFIRNSYFNPSLPCSMPLDSNFASFTDDSPVEKVLYVEKCIEATIKKLGNIENTYKEKMNNIIFIIISKKIDLRQKENTEFYTDKSDRQECGFKWEKYVISQKKDLENIIENLKEEYFEPIKKLFCSTLIEEDDDNNDLDNYRDYNQNYYRFIDDKYGEFYRLYVEYGQWKEEGKEKEHIYDEKEPKLEPIMEIEFTLKKEENPVSKGGQAQKLPQLHMYRFEGEHLKSLNNLYNSLGKYRNMMDIILGGEDKIEILQKNIFCKVCRENKIFLLYVLKEIDKVINNKDIYHIFSKSSMPNILLFAENFIEAIKALEDDPEVRGKVSDIIKGIGQKGKHSKNGTIKLGVTEFSSVVLNNDNKKSYMNFEGSNSAFFKNSGFQNNKNYPKKSNKFSNSNQKKIKNKYDNIIYEPSANLSNSKLKISNAHLFSHENVVEKKYTSSDYKLQSEELYDEQGRKVTPGEEK